MKPAPWPIIEASDKTGCPYLRAAKYVGELPSTDERFSALTVATRRLAEELAMVATRRIPFGAPVYLAFGLRPADAKRHPLADLLLLNGDMVPLEWATAEREGE